MKNKIVSYKLQSYLALIPFFGFFIVFGSTWFNIYRITNNKFYIVLHYLICIIPCIIFLGVDVLITYLFISRLQDLTLEISLSLILYYFVLLAIEFSAIGIQKGIIERYLKKSVL